MNLKNESIIRRRAVITPEYLSQIKNSGKNYSSLILERLAKKNVLRKIKRGKYTESSNIYSISTNLVFPSYLSFWSGIAYKGCTEQILNTLFVACTKKTREIKFEGYRIKFIKLPKSRFFGYSKERTGNEEVFIADNEKLLIDCLLYSKYSGNIDEIVKFIESEDFDTEKLKSYLKRIKNKSLIQKAGYLLEKYKNIKLNIKYSGRNYAFLPVRTKEKLNKKWRIKFDNN